MMVNANKSLLLLILFASLFGPKTRSLLNFFHPASAQQLGPAAVAASEPHTQQPSIGQPSSINLKSILEHQQGLELECANYHAEQQRQLELLLKFNRDNDNQFQLPHPIALKVPAVCLFLFDYSQQQSKRQPNNKLKLVNWLYDQDETPTTNTTKSSISKRHVQGHLNGNAPPEMLGDFLVNSNAIDAMPSDPFGAADPETAKYHDQLEAMIEDKRFKIGVENSRQELANHLSPVVLIPGLLGSRLQAKINKPNRVNILCSKQMNWQDIWLSIKLLLPLLVDCWLDNVRLEFDPNTGFSKLPSGVQVRVASFGSVESVKHLDISQRKASEYFSSLIEHYERLGYTADLNLLAAPYDFRLAPQELEAQGYFVALKRLIEKAQDESASGKKVTLVCHSMGCTNLLIFLRQQSAAWRQSRVRKLIAISSPWGGAIKALKALVVGDQLDLPLVSEAKMRRLARSYPSIAFLLPQAEVFQRPTKNRADDEGPILVKTPVKVYKVGQLGELLTDLNLTRQFDWFKQTSSLIKPLEPLQDLQVDCIHSLNTPTPETLLFRQQDEFPNGDYELIKGEGDGTVNLESLMVCSDWAKKLPDKVKHTIIMNVNHVGVLSHKTTLAHITDDVMNN